MVDQSFQKLYRQAISGSLTRRQVLKRGAALGLAAPAIAALLAACGSSSSTPTSAATTAPTTAAATTAPTTAATTSTGGTAATPAATTASAASPTAAATTAAATTEAGAGRGKGGQLKLLWWQAPTILNSHLSQGTKDYDATRPVLEPLADFDVDGKMVAILAAEIPSLDNGGVSQDGMSVTWKLKPGVTWSDGQPFTADDVKFTYDFVNDPATTATTAANYAVIDSVTSVDPNTVKIAFKKPTPGWFGVFCGDYGRILPQHVLKDSTGAAARNAPFNLKPIGTGPYKVDDFQAGDHVDYSINDTYREADKPFFKTVNLKGGGDATSAARAAIQTGEVDFAWNLQVEWGVLQSLKGSGPGDVDINPGIQVERILVNLTDPNKEVNGEKSHLGTPHPFQADLAVRQAYALGIQRDVLTTQLYGDTGAVTSNVLCGPANFVSKNTSWKYDIDAANKLLDTAGWAKSGNVRAKGGVQMNVTYQTSVNDLRQKEQEIVKQGFAQLGINVTIKSIDASVYFSSDAGNDQTSNHFYADLEMFTNGPTTPYPLDYMVSWWGDPSNIAQKSNSWAGNNCERWQSADYDAAYASAQTELDPTKQAPLFVTMNDLVVNQVVEIPLVQRNGVSGVNKKLKNINASPWVTNLWNIANWQMES